MGTRDGGPTEVVKRLSQQLDVLGHQSAVVTTDKHLEADSQLWDLDAVQVVQSRPPRRLNFAPGVGRVIRKQMGTADLLHVHAADSYTSTIAMRHAARARVPYIFQPHGAYDDYHRHQNQFLKRAWYKICDERLVAGAAAIVASSPREAEGIMAFCGRPAEVIPLGVDPRLFRAPSTTRPQTVLFLGRLTAKKRVDVAIRGFAVSGAPARGWRMVIAGPLDPRLPYMPSAVAREAGVADSVEFVGEVDGERRAELLANARVFVLPSEDESFGLSVAEAMASGAAVIASSQVGIAPPAARDNAVAVSAPTVESFSRSLRELTVSPHRLDDLARSGQRYAMEHFQWSSVSARFAALYERVVG